MNHRDYINYQRRKAAEALASYAGGYSEEAIEEAANLLNRCTRYAIAQTRHDESETAENHNKRWYIHEGELLFARYERLNKELEKYGCRICCLGYFCNNVYRYDFENHTVSGNGLLHFHK